MSRACVRLSPPPNKMTINFPRRAVWDLESGRERFVLPFRGTIPHGMAFSADSRFFALGDLKREGLVALWECKAWGASAADRKPFMYLTNGFEAGSLAFSPDGRILAVAGLSFPPVDPIEPSGATNRLAFWEFGSWKKLNPLPEAGVGRTEWEAAGTVALSRDGRWLATGHRDGWVRLWDLQRQQLLKMLKLQDTSGWSVDVHFSPDDRWLAAHAISGAKVVLFDLADPERPPIPLIRDEPSGVLQLEFAPDNRTLVTGHVNGEVRFWNLA